MIIMARAGNIAGPGSNSRRSWRLRSPRRRASWWRAPLVVGHNSVVSFPDWIEPMAATLTPERFAGPEWIFERKFDGIRLLAFRQGTHVRLLSRNRLPQNCPLVAAAIAKLGVQDVILDGELTWGNSGVAYHVFDIPWL